MKAASSPPHELLRIAYYKAPPVSAVKPFIIPAGAEVVELVTGGVVYFPGRDGLKLGCGALFWHVAGEETIHLTEPHSPYECLALRFAAIGGRRPAPRLSFISDHQRTRELCGELLRSYHDESIDRNVLADYARSRLLWEAHLGGERRPADAPPPAVETARLLIEKRFGRPDLGVSDLARAAGISEPHLHALFRKHLGQAPHQYLTARRIREAKLLLSGGTSAIKSIADQCGFLNIETFYRAFKKQVGATPSHFRKTHSLPVLAGQ